MGQALYRKWRPQSFDEVIGQQPIVQTLRRALRTGHIHHAYLLAGPRGTGKTTTARLIAKAVNCLAPPEERPCNRCAICRAVTEGRLMDLVEIDAASNTGVDHIRDLLERVNFRPAEARYKVYVVDEVHMLSTSAFNALLKTLEEPPPHVIFVLATTEVHRIPLTVLSRCQRFEFRRIPLEAIVGQLRRIAEAEGIEVEAEALGLIARAATGSMRDAISLLDQLSAGGAITTELVRSLLGAERGEVVRALAQAWLDGDARRGVEVINGAVSGGADPKQLARQMADFLRGLLLVRLGAGDSWEEPLPEERPRLQEMARRARPRRLVEAIRLFGQAAAERHTSWQPQLPLELAFVEATLEPEVVPSPAPVQAAAPASESVPAPATRRRGTPPPRVVLPRKVAAAASPGDAAPSPAPGEGGEVSAALVAQLQEQWREVVRRVEPVMLSALLRDARPLGAEGGALVLGFQHEFHRGRVAQAENLRRVEAALSRIAGQPLRVRCVMAKAWKPAVGQTARAASSAPASKVPPVHVPPPPPEPPDSLEELAQRAERELGAIAQVEGEHRG